MYDFLFGNSGSMSGEEMSQWLEMTDTMSTLTSCVIALVFAVIAYIFQGKTMYAIAKRRGIDKPWLAWVPVGSSWMMGCISDQYRYVVRGENKNKRKTLMWLEIAQLAVVLVLYGVVMAMLITGIQQGVEGDWESFFGSMVAGSVGMIFVMLLMLGVSAAYSVVYYFALWDFYRSCDPQRSVLFFLLSLLISYPRPFLMYTCRDKDLGMPPRRDALPEYEPVPEAPVAQPTQEPMDEV